MNNFEKQINKRYATKHDKKRKRALEEAGEFTRLMEFATNPRKWIRKILRSK